MAGDEQRVLLLGAGMVSDPLAHYYSMQQKVQLTVASESRKDGQRLSTIGDNINSVSWYSSRMWITRFVGCG